MYDIGRSKWTVCSVGHGHEQLRFPRTPYNVARVVLCAMVVFERGKRIFATFLQNFNEFLRIF